MGSLLGCIISLVTETVDSTLKWYTRLEVVRFAHGWVLPA